MPVAIYDAVTWSEGRGKPKNPMSCMPLLLAIQRGEVIWISTEKRTVPPFRVLWAMLMVPAITRIWLVILIPSVEK